MEFPPDISRRNGSYFYGSQSTMEKPNPGQGQPIGNCKWISPSIASRTALCLQVLQLPEDCWRDCEGNDFVGSPIAARHGRFRHSRSDNSYFDKHVTSLPAAGPTCRAVWRNIRQPFTLLCHGRPAGCRHPTIEGTRVPRFSTAGQIVRRMETEENHE